MRLSLFSEMHLAALVLNPHPFLLGEEQGPDGDEGEEGVEQGHGDDAPEQFPHGPAVHPGSDEAGEDGGQVADEGRDQEQHQVVPPDQVTGQDEVVQCGQSEGHGEAHAHEHVPETPGGPGGEGPAPGDEIVEGDLVGAGAPAAQLGPHDGEPGGLLVVEDAFVQITHPVAFQGLLDAELDILGETAGVPALLPEQVRPEGEAGAREHGGEAQVVAGAVVEAVQDGPVEGVPLAHQGVVGVLGQPVPGDHAGPFFESAVHVAEEVRPDLVVRVEEEDAVEGGVPENPVQPPVQHGSLAGAAAVRPFPDGDAGMGGGLRHGAVGAVVRQHEDMIHVRRIVLVLQAFQQMPDHFLLVVGADGHGEAVDGVCRCGSLPLFPPFLREAQEGHGDRPEEEGGEEQL